MSSLQRCIFFPTARIISNRMREEHSHVQPSMSFLQGGTILTTWDGNSTDLRCSMLVAHAVVKSCSIHLYHFYLKHTVNILIPTSSQSHTAGYLRVLYVLLHGSTIHLGMEKRGRFNGEQKTVHHTYHL